MYIFIADTIARYFTYLFLKVITLIMCLTSLKRLQKLFTFLYWCIKPDRFVLTHNTLGKIISRRHFEIFFSDFSQKTVFDTSCKLSPLETICMKCRILFSGKNKKNITNLSSAELAQRVVKVKLLIH